MCNVYGTNEVNEGMMNFAAMRERMVREQLEDPARSITSPCVLAAMGKVPRHEFVSQNHQDDAYGDMALPIGQGFCFSLSNPRSKKDIKFFCFLASRQS